MAPRGIQTDIKDDSRAKISDIKLVAGLPLTHSAIGTFPSFFCNKCR